MKVKSAFTTLLLGSIASAQVSKKCNNNVCYSLNIPESTGSSGDIFFQLSAPTSMQWVALGQGTRMAGANIFLMYADASGKNITLSPRAGKGEFEPKFNPDAKVTLLDGSGISDGKMVANVRCESCTSWFGGKQDFTSSSGDWIFSYKAGDSIASNSVSADITEHDDKGQLSFDFASAKGGKSVNPLVVTAATNNTSQTGGDGGDSGDSDGFSGQGLSDSMEAKLQKAHGILASLAFVVFWPIGAIIIRVLSFQGLIWVHAALQVFAWVLFIAAFGIGVYLANNLNELGEYHPVIGIILFCLVAFQPFLGLVHHQMCKKYGRRTLTSYVHIWLGRLIITLGIINGGLGLMLADDTTGGEIAYGVVAGIIWLVYVLAAVFGEVKRTKSRKQEQQQENGGFTDKQRSASPADSPTEQQSAQQPLSHLQ